MTLVELPADKTVCGDVRETGRPGATSARALRGAYCQSGTRCPSRMTVVEHGGLCKNTELK